VKLNTFRVEELFLSWVAEFFIDLLRAGESFAFEFRDSLIYHILVAISLFKFAFVFIAF
jgi:hypothetical protein